MRYLAGLTMGCCVILAFWMPPVVMPGFNDLNWVVQGCVALVYTEIICAAVVLMAFGMGIFGGEE